MCSYGVCNIYIILSVADLFLQSKKYDKNALLQLLKVIISACVYKKYNFC